MKRSFIIFVMNCNVIYFFSPVDLSYTSQRGEGADSLEYSRTFHWGNHLNGAKSQTAQSGNTTHWRASIILLLKNIFTSNSLYRISISCCPPFLRCDRAYSPLLFLFLGFLVHRSASAMDEACLLFSSATIHQAFIWHASKLISNSLIQKILFDPSRTACLIS